MIVCKRCGFSLAETARFCSQCGRAVNYTPTPKKRGNGQGTAIKRGKTWTGFRPGYSYHDENGVKHRVRPSKGGFLTKKDALAWAAGSRTDCNAPAPRSVWKNSEYRSGASIRQSRSTGGLMSRMPNPLHTISVMADYAVTRTRRGALRALRDSC